MQNVLSNISLTGPCHFRLKCSYGVLRVICRTVPKSRVTTSYIYYSILVVGVLTVTEVHTKKELTCNTALSCSKSCSGSVGYKCGDDGCPICECLIKVQTGMTRLLKRSSIPSWNFIKENQSYADKLQINCQNVAMLTDFYKCKSHRVKISVL